MSPARACNVVVLPLGLLASFRRGFPFLQSRRERAVVLLVGAVAGLSSRNNGQSALLAVAVVARDVAELRARAWRTGDAVAETVGARDRDR